jgi:peptidoglycan-N-acetylglucosamine deacetylase
VIARRITLGLILVLVTSLAVAVIVGVDDTTRAAVADRLWGTDRASASPSAAADDGSPDPDPTTARPSATRSATPTPSPTTAKSTPKAMAKTKASTKAPSPKPSGSRSPKEVGSSSDSKRKSSSTSQPSKSSRGVVYMTFDDGPGAYTPQVLSILRRTGSTATFFQLGVNRPGHSSMIAAIKAQGSNIGNHTYSHRDLTTLSASQLRYQIANGPDTKCFRPPYGATNATVRRAVAAAGQRQVLWTVDTLDWSKPGVSSLKAIGLRKSIGSGSIILMHDGGGDRTQTVAALPGLIRNLQSRGFKVRALPYC